VLPPEELPLPSHEDAGLRYAVLQGDPVAAQGFQCFGGGEQVDLHGAILGFLVLT